MQNRHGSVWSNRRAAPRLVLCLCTIAALLPFVGCEAPPGTPLDNVPPETYLSISGAQVDTTHYVIPLHWWGSDEDGEIAKYQYRWDEPWAPDTSDTVVLIEDTLWVETRTTSRDFIVPVQGTNSSPGFLVRAIDDAGEADPSPGHQRFYVRNEMPTIEFGEDLARPTRSLPAVTFSLIGKDEDGGETIAGYRVWFEGQDAAEDAFIYEGGDSAHITLLPDNFPGPGMQTVFIQAMDEAETFSSDTLSHMWEIIDVEGKRVLVIDHHPNDHPASWGPRVDAFYAETIGASVGYEQVVFWDFESDGAFRAAGEVEVAFSTFDAVFWYTGVQMNITSVTTERAGQLQLVREGLLDYVRDGGKVFLECTFAYGNGGNYGEPFVPTVWDSVETYEFLGILRPFRNARGNSNFGIRSGTAISANPEWGLEPLLSKARMNYIDFVPLPPNSEAIVWAPPGTVEIDNDTTNPFDYHCAFSLPIGSAGGEFVSLTFPLALANADTTAGLVLEAIVERFLD